jgi:hypothetical protein
MIKLGRLIIPPVDIGGAKSTKPIVAFQQMGYN